MEIFEIVPTSMSFECQRKQHQKRNLIYKVIIAKTFLYPSIALILWSHYIIGSQYHRTYIKRIFTINLKIGLFEVYSSVHIFALCLFPIHIISFYSHYIVCAWIGAIKLGYLQSTWFLNSTIYNQTTLCVILSIYLCVHLLLYGLTINHTIKVQAWMGKILSPSSCDMILSIYYGPFTFLL